MEIKNWSMDWGGRPLTVETGRLALQANASCTVRYGDTVIMATAVMSKNTRDGIDFFPLSVDFEEKLYAAGKIKGSRFIKREGRPSDDAILSGRLIDRSVRPLFDQNMRNDVQIILTALSLDNESDTQVASLLAASIVLSISDIPWAGPIVGVRIGRVNAEWKLNPTPTEREAGDTDIVVVGQPEKIIMVEAGCKEVPEEQIIEAMRFGAKEMKSVLDFINKIQSEVGLQKMDLNANKNDKDIELEKVEAQVRQFVASHVNDWIFDSVKKGRKERNVMLDKFNEAVGEILKSQETDETIQKIVLGRIKIYVEELITEKILKEDKRLDGRSLTDIRELKAQVGFLPRTHGSGLFSRGDTQVLSVITLGAPGDVQTLDSMEEEGTKRYMHHYNDTPATYGETGFMRGPGRRAIGHGALAERALEPVLPSPEEFPYAIRIVSEVLGSNGSSSMASTCGSTLSLMDAGVPIKKPVVGIAMGLASNTSGDWKIITDLQDVEDGPGGMDFKITGTRDGITAMQMDTKTAGLSWEIVEQTFKQSHEARLKVLEAMQSAISAPRAEMSPYAPRITTLHINPDKIRDVIGPGGKVINKIIADTGVSIDIEDDGRVMITSTNAEGAKKAIEIVKAITHEVTAGEEYEGTVARLEDFGAFVNILPGQDGLVHVSEINYEHVNKPGDVLNIGQSVKVKVKEIDNLGRINLSMKALLPKPEGYVERPPRDRAFGSGSRGSRFGGNGRNRPRN
ncbi:MAG: polyribonucleotide nucleotidyltransferase [Candidatus Magasanikbacteria bacterium CG10_big_fil_rev_8_21_14_0_10_40_10]|uniref:Polyribonucleotide nucleotidyltransferase n=1 Tax=Candidatus Magasanikbacteria bacterium CG10_big_fil_rev_8_21_14_0_10_40_10 TaxID=1974648 RepID=A0A2M6W2R7_9BACT|nr:MAG: polyribonucleotide nucleotidyltransferase [Candidatus Magasanikbacteria bacterium CG10_big_fil_rev_8_21_14_0_10_40_10]